MANEKKLTLAEQIAALQKQMEDLATQQKEQENAAREAVCTAFSKACDKSGIDYVSGLKIVREKFAPDTGAGRPKAQATIDAEAKVLRLLSRDHEAKVENVTTASKLAEILGVKSETVRFVRAEINAKRLAYLTGDATREPTAPTTAANS